MLLRLYPHFILDRMVKHTFIIVPVCDCSTILNRVLQREEASFALWRISYFQIYALTTRMADESGEDAARGVVACPTNTTPAGANVQNDWTSVLISKCCSSRY